LIEVSNNQQTNIRLCIEYACYYGEISMGKKAKEGTDNLFMGGTECGNRWIEKD